MSDRDQASRYIAETIAAVEAAELPGVEQKLQLAAIKVRDLEALLDGAGEDTLRAVVLAWEAGYIRAAVDHRAVGQALGAAREKAKGAKHWISIYLAAERMGWSLPVDRDQKSTLLRLFVRETGLKERTFRKHYEIAVHHAEQLRRQENTL